MIVEKETLEEVFEYINNIEKDKEFFVTIHLNGGDEDTQKNAL